MDLPSIQNVERVLENDIPDKNDASFLETAMQALLMWCLLDRWLILHGCIDGWIEHRRMDGLAAGSYQQTASY